MPILPATKRHQDLNCHLSDILHQYLLACDALHNHPLADIEDNLSTIHLAVLRCRFIIANYKKEHEGG